MKEIIYKGKKVKVPFEGWHGIYTLDGEKDVEQSQNPDSVERRQQCLDTRPLFTTVIIGSEAFVQDWDRHRREGLRLVQPQLSKTIYGAVRLMKFTTVSIKEIQADKTHRLDAKYWINKKNKKNKSTSPQAGGPAHKESGFKQA